jgi:hypothetical protein
MRLHAAGGPGAAALLSATVQRQEDDMSEIVMTTEAEVEDFTEELSDELSCFMYLIPPVSDR